MPEQLPVDPTMWWEGKRNPDTGAKICRFRKVLLNGKPRLRNPETGGPLIMSGDIAKFDNGTPDGILRLRWNNSWIDIPSIDEFQEWTIDSCCPTPDGSIVEPDAPDSWLSLVGLV